MAADTESSGFLSPDTFAMAVDALPLISMDLCVTNASHQLMLGLRKNRPAQGFWFTPGGRIRKGEGQDVAFRRLVEEELSLTGVAFNRATLMGVWDHFYEESAFSNSVSTHYVNLPYWIALTEVEVAQISMKDQHIEWRWFDMAEDKNDSVHPYSQAYLNWLACSRAAE
ncbi:GDP-mannose mannosyl hydrolase [Sphingobium yanoikuyae]|uniref:NUDIX domain-containing protein n=1 Tax=Sphingobium yanoikuyae TaxID=13690 RepID=A0A3G2USU7_SPHYA|nr:NUDIX domain-containing protein [Sphingobium yanoikuyae]AYO77218.1 NUDIX domain-containing protein [Sphingobium yanoikuyae]